VAGRLGPGFGVAPLSVADDRVVAAAGTAAAAVGLVGFFAVAGAVGPDLWVPLLVLLVLTAVSVPMIRLASGRPIDSRLRKILLVAFALKMLCTFPRYAMNEVVYGGSADARAYHDAGQVFRDNALDGELTIEGSELSAFAEETRFVGYATGVLYLGIGASQMGGYLVFAWLSWVGLMCAFSAFRVAYPKAPPYLAAGLIFFLPSTLYWPSSIGKDALMVLGLGLVTLGVTRLLVAARPLLGLLWLSMGAALVLQVRAHLLLIALVGAAVALLARNAAVAPTRTAILGRIALLVALVPVLVLGLSRMDDMFGSTKDGGSFSVTAALDKASGQTSIGGSAFEAQAVTSPIDLPVATINVLYRPFIFEASSVPALVSALEGTLLLGLTIAGARWLWRIGPAMYRNPLAAYCGGFVLAFVFAFSNLGNAGILARQRVQMFPILMLLVAAAAEHRRAAAGEPSTTDPSAQPRLVLVP
jgi:hypothetical protein